MSNAISTITTHIKFHWSPNEADGYAYAGWVETIRSNRRHVGVRVIKPIEVRLEDGPHKGETVTIPVGTECRHVYNVYGIVYGIMEADIPAVSATFSDGMTNPHAAAHWSEMMAAWPDLVGCHRVTIAYCDPHGHGPRSMWTVSLWVRREIAELIGRPDPQWQFATNAPSVGNYNSAYSWAGAVLANPEACEEIANKADAEVDAYLLEQCLWQEAHQACPLPCVAPQDAPERRKIGSMGFRAWKAAYDAAVQANKQHHAYMAWCNDYVDKRN